MNPPLELYEGPYLKYDLSDEDLNQIGERFFYEPMREKMYLEYDEEMNSYLHGCTRCGALIKLEYFGFTDYDVEQFGGTTRKRITFNWKITLPDGRIENFNPKME